MLQIAQESKPAGNINMKAFESIDGNADPSYEVTEVGYKFDRDVSRVQCRGHPFPARRNGGDCEIEDSMR